MFAATFCLMCQFYTLENDFLSQSSRFFSKSFFSKYMFLIILILWFGLLAYCLQLLGVP